ncbi:hypothetical protein F5Y11DRAFT_345745 [Daldinia sp. FL1419]|nr:hypothetical protein F5Y11DRAFT_345745 [Daldinia sp. FL1419]
MEWLAETDTGMDADLEAKVNKTTSLSPVELGDDAISSTTASSVSDTESSPELPTLRKLSPGLEPFECPICFTPQSFTSKKVWKAHVFSDLKGEQYMKKEPSAQRDDYMLVSMACFKRHIATHQEQLAAFVVSRHNEDEGEEEVEEEEEGDMIVKGGNGAGIA